MRWRKKSVGRPGPYRRVRSSPPSRTLRQPPDQSTNRDNDHHLLPLSPGNPALLYHPGWQLVPTPDPALVPKRIPLRNQLLQLYRPSAPSRFIRRSPRLSRRRPPPEDTSVESGPILPPKPVRRRMKRTQRRNSHDLLHLPNENRGARLSRKRPWPLRLPRHLKNRPNPPGNWSLYQLTN